LHRFNSNISLNLLISFGLDDKSGDDDNDDDDDSDDDDENCDLIKDSWGDDVVTGDSELMDVDDVDNDDDIRITKQKLAETIQKGRSLIKLIKRSQIITMFVDNEKQSLNVNQRLITDCISRWNSTYLSLKALLEHKPALLKLFENKRKLPITSKQKEKLYELELSSDDWILFSYLIEIFEPFYQATEYLSGSKYPTIGLALFVIRNLKEYFEKEEDDDPNVVIDLKKFISTSLNHYFDENDKQFQLLMVSDSIYSSEEL